MKYVFISKELADPVIEAHQQMFFEMMLFKYSNGDEFWRWYVGRNSLILSLDEIRNPSTDLLNRVFVAYTHDLAGKKDRTALPTPVTIRSLFYSDTDFLFCRIIMDRLLIHSDSVNGYDLFALINVFREKKIFKTFDVDRIMYAFNLHLKTDFKVSNLNKNKWASPKKYKEAHQLISSQLEKLQSNQVKK